MIRTSYLAGVATFATIWSAGNGDYGWAALFGVFAMIFVAGWYAQMKDETA